MASRIVEFFGYNPEDRSPAATEARHNLRCPFLGRQCVKTLSDGLISGACTLKPVNAGPVICCPIRLYANNYEILRDVARVSFGPVIPLVSASSITDDTGECVAVFGKGWGKELRLPTRAKSGAYFVDWVLAHVSAKGELINFVAVEVQSIDTTGNYRHERDTYLKEESFQGKSTAGFNWENVNIQKHPHAADRNYIDDQTGYKRSSRDAYIQRLKARQLVEIVAGEVRASKDLF
jgi:hypothetical protein